MIKKVAFPILFLSVSFLTGCVGLPSTKLLERTTPLSCSRIGGAVGPEDLELLKEDHLLVVSSHDKRNYAQAEGKLYLLDTSALDKSRALVPMPVTFPKNFRPHGMSSRATDTGVELYVISHPLEEGARHTIEVFEFQRRSRSWFHARTLKSPLLVSPNDLVALPSGELFISNDNFDLGGKLAEALDGMFGRKRAPIVFFDGKEFQNMGHPTGLGNGMAYIREGNKEWIYRASSISKELDRFLISRHEGGGVTLEPNGSLLLASGPDNITLTESGSMIVAGHPAPGLMMKHQEDASVKSPSQILLVKTDGQVRELYSDNGAELSAASVGVEDGKTLFIGQIFDEGILRCQL